MEFVAKQSLEVRNGVNGNYSAMCFVRGRQAFEDGASIFDCPFETGSDKAELWMDGYMYAERKTRA